jgi:hypothetical protein
MTPLTIAVWNRAATEGGGASPRAGDEALSALLLAHGLVMSGGLSQAVDGLQPSELAAARQGYRFFGFEEVAKILERPIDELEASEAELLSLYVDAIPDDQAIMDRFVEHFGEHPELYSPVEASSQ